VPNETINVNTLKHHFHINTTYIQIHFLTENALRLRYEDQAVSGLYENNRRFSKNLIKPVKAHCWKNCNVMFLMLDQVAAMVITVFEGLETLNNSSIMNSDVSDVFECNTPRNYLTCSMKVALYGLSERLNVDPVTRKHTISLHVLAVLTLELE
jgi:hypothetical protein